MAEAAGLVIGAVALVGLYGTCVQFYDIASRAKSKDHDFLVLHQRLGVQKTRFEACRKSLHLDKRQPCECCPIVSKKEDAGIAETIEMICELFEEGVKIEGRHASKKREIKRASMKPKRKFWRGRSHGAIPGQWVMKDRDQFERVVDELERLVTSLEIASDRVKFKRLRAMKRRTRHLFGLSKGKGSDSAKELVLEAYATVKEIGR